MAPLSISRDANNITLSGDFPDDSAKAALLKAIKGGLGPGVNVIDQIKINPNVDALDFSNAGPIFKDSASITDFNLTVNGDTVTLAGTAASADQKNTIEKAAVHTWSNLNVVDHLVVNGSGPPINGYTDNTGTDGINIRLSSQRAGTVADFLASKSWSAKESPAWIS